MTVDYFSGFFEIDRLYDLKASTVIMKLYALMARYGIPDEVVSDSGSLCKSREFKAFVKEYGCKHMKKRPYHHQSNGKVESAVKKAKKIVKNSATTLTLILILPFIQNHSAKFSFEFLQELLMM